MLSQVQLYKWTMPKAHARCLLICICLSSVGTLLLAIIIHNHYVQPRLTLDSCIDNDFLCAQRCPAGYFILPWMVRCESYLNCNQIKTEVKVDKLVGRGAVKAVYLGKWQEHEVIVNTLVSEDLTEDFRHGLEMLIALQSHANVTQLLGYCPQSNVFITEYHELGTADKLNDILQMAEYNKYDNPLDRFRLCINYVSILNDFHTSPIGTRVMCDSNDLMKTLSQYLVTKNFKLLANDLDALPRSNSTHNLLIKCGQRQLFGDFIAPEQLWPYPEKDFNDSIMPGYDEKTDIWKIPSVCHYFLGDSGDSETLKFHLFSIHNKCKALKPGDRPSAKQILMEYQVILKDFMDNM